MILKFLSFIPDSVMVKWQYWIKMGRKLNLSSPKRFSEKLQWYKVYYRNPIMSKCVDKYEVREYLKNKGLSYILPNLYGIYNNAKEIDFISLPQKFVLKTTDGTGGQNVLICRDKSLLNWDETITLVNSWLNKKNIDAGREWAYTKMKSSRIIIEEYLENTKNPNAGIQDYKFFCFSGNPFMVCVDSNRFINHKRNIYSISWKKINVRFNEYPYNEEFDEKPKNYDEMLKIVRELSAEFPHVRVDLYNVDGKIYFGELTFYPSSGYCTFDPDEFDFILGKQFILPTNFLRK